MSKEVRELKIENCRLRLSLLQMEYERVSGELRALEQEQEDDQKEKKTTQGVIKG